MSDTDSIHSPDPQPPPPLPAPLPSMAKQAALKRERRRYVFFTDINIKAPTNYIMITKILYLIGISN